MSEEAPAAPSANDSSIANMVKQLKEGQISKAELFQRLTTLYRKNPQQAAFQFPLAPPPQHEEGPESPIAAHAEIPATPEMPPPPSASVVGGATSFEVDVDEQPRQTPPSPSRSLPRAASVGRRQQQQGGSPTGKTTSKRFTEDPYEQFTFKPSILPLPAEYEGRLSQTNFLDRVYDWQDKSQGAKQQLKEILEWHQVKDCTFKPQLNQLSQAMIHTRQQTALVAARSTMKVERLKVELKQKEEDEFQQKCTFRPQLNKKSLRIAVTKGLVSKHLSPKKQPVPDPESEGLTFTPQVNPINPNFEAAQIYLEQNAFERLSTPAWTSAPAVESPREGGDVPSSRPSTAGSERPRSSSAIRRPPMIRTQSASRLSMDRRDSMEDAEVYSTASLSPTDGAGSTTSLAQKAPPPIWNSFLQRQEKCTMKKQDKIDRIKQQDEASVSGRPSTNPKSIQLTERRCADRWAILVNPEAKSISSSRRRATTPPPSELADGECTFKPKITEKAKQRPSRSLEDLSFGDLARKMAKLEEAKTCLEQETLKEASFRPAINAGKAVPTDSYLKISSDPDSYIERVQQKQKENEAKRQLLQAAFRELEAQKCTFHPEVHDAPAFVKEEAQKQAMLKAMRSVSRPKARPDWR